MKAAFIERHGGPEVLKYGDLPDPTAGPGEVVIDIVAASVNGADWKVRLGDYKQSKFPYVLGRDFSGVTGAVGEGVQDLRVGDAVFGVCEAGQEGAYAEKIAVKAAIVAKKPSSLSHVNAAALALTGLTAFIASGAQAPKPNRDDVTSLRPPVGRARRHLERIAELYAAGAIRPPEVKLYRLSEAADAHRLSESRHFRGKLVFQVR